MNARLITTYVNPDLDGVACMVALAEYLAPDEWQPTYAGSLNAEIRAVLAELGPIPIAKVDRVPSDASIVLVDTHHVLQLPEGLDPTCVVEIVDHHPGGDATAFVNARVQNEFVGAAATLVAERFALSRRTMTSAAARLLACGILSNTLDFRAPSTDVRDREAFDWLVREHGVPDSLRSALTLGRQALITGDTSAILCSDVKVFASNVGLVAMSQIEAPGASKIGDRPDFADALAHVARVHGAAHVVVNLADLDLGASRLFVSETGLLDLVSHLLTVRCRSEGWAARLLLRKVDLVPAMIISET